MAYQDWNVTVVATYRRYYEWILSTYKEVNRRNCLASQAKWHRGGGGGKPCKDLWNMIHSRISSKRYGGSFYHNLDESLPAWRSAEFSVQLLNAHDAGHITCRLYCHVIGTMPHTCQECLQRQPSHLNVQSSSYTAYNDILFAADQMGLLDQDEEWNSKSRNQATWDLYEYHTQVLKKQLKDLPLICPHPVKLEQLLNKSLAFEELVYPKDHLTKRNEHVALFWKAANDDKEFCAVDTKRLFHEKHSWKQVLESIKSTTQEEEWPIRYYE